MGLHRWNDGTFSHVVIPFGDEVVKQSPPTLLNDTQPIPPWLDNSFLERLDEINGRDDERQRIVPLDIPDRTTTADAIDAFAHEIRTPLSTIHATLELLDDDTTIDRVELSEMIHRLQRGVAWINDLVDGLADGACRGTENTDLMPLHFAPTDVCGWIDDAIALVRPIAEQRKQSILLACPNPVPVVRGDSLRLGQVMVNLLSNACRYGAWADTITVTVYTNDDCVAIRVSDHGIGIAPEDLDRVFQRHVRCAQASQRHADGKGLGLAITRTIVEQHGGTIEVDSVASQGTTFTVRLPAMHIIRPLVLRRVKIEESEVVR